MSQLILASASPRRRELLSRLGVEFEVRPSNVDEDPLPGETPLQTQHRITRDKAAAAEKRLEIGNSRVGDAQSPVTSVQSLPIIIACDTTVLLDGEMLNKPADADQARIMLRKLRGRTHDVQSAIVIRQGDAETVDIVTSQVVMRPYTDAEIEAYIATGDPFDKAGSYAVQHEIFSPVERICGCPLNVIGLSLCHLRARLPQLPETAPVCASYFGRPCPNQLADPAHCVGGAVNLG